MVEWRCLSLTQPWVWIILHLGKRVENRPRNIGNYRGPLLLHAAKRMTQDDWCAAYGFVAQQFGHRVAERIPTFDSAELVRGAIVGRTRVIDQHKPGELWPWGETQGRWYMGQHAYRFDPAVEPFVAPVPCKGALGFWRPPVAALAALGLEAA